MASMYTELDSYKLTNVTVTDKELGRGSYTTVLEVVYKGQKCAGKKIHEILLLQGIGSYAVKRFEEECHLLSCLRHPNVVQFIGYYYERNATAPILVMEYLPTNLTSCIESKSILTKETSYSILLDVAKGFSYLHSQVPPIIHRDLSANNVLLTSSMTAKISDLGVAKIVDLTPLQVSRMTQMPGTPAYMPPEVMTASPKYDTSVDVFSYGILMIHVLCGQWPEPQVGQVCTIGDQLVPFSEADRRKVYLASIGDGHPLMELILSCIKNIPHLRPSATRIMDQLATLVGPLPSSHPPSFHLDFVTLPENEVSKSKKMGQLNRAKVAYEVVVPLKVKKEVSKSAPAKDQEKELQMLSNSGNPSTSSVQKQLHVTKSKADVKQKKNKAKQSKPSGTKGNNSVATSTASNYLMYIVKHDYKSRTRDDMSLKQGDRLCIISTNKQDRWLALSPDTGKQAYVPRSCITELPFPTYTAVYDCQSYKEQHLNFKKGEEFTIIHTGDGTWWYAQSINNFSEGFIPQNYVTRVKYPIFVAMYDYKAQTNEDLEIVRNDLLYVMNANDRNWWFARSRKTGKDGYIPSNYVAKLDTLNVHKWYFGDISRVEAQKRLLEEGNQRGSYLVRQSESVPGAYSLSVRSCGEKVIHIKILHEKGAFYIKADTTFKSIADLVSHYKQYSPVHGCALLINPCVFSEKPQTVGICKCINDNWEIDKSEISLVKNVGAGNYTDIWEGLLNEKACITVKVLKSDSVPVSEFLQEAFLMKNLCHPNLLQIFGICTKEPPYYIITEFMSHGSLLEHLQRARKTLDLHQLIGMAQQVVQGMAYLEKHDYVHRDLAARSILVGDRMVCKVANFGLTQPARSAGCKVNLEIKFAIKWTAPEALLHYKFSIKSDVWSFGVVLYEIVTYGQSPYDGMTNDEVVAKVKQGYRMPQPTECSNKFYNIMLKCWREEPENRPAFLALQWELEELLESTRQAYYKDCLR